MTFDELTQQPVYETTVSCADNKFGTLIGFDADSECAVVHILGQQTYRFIPARDLVLAVTGTLAQMKGGR